jgi:hypothetical protein
MHAVASPLRQRPLPSPHAPPRPLSRSCAAPWACPPPLCACAGPTASRASPRASARGLSTPHTRCGFVSGVYVRCLSFGLQADLAALAAQAARGVARSSVGSARRTVSQLSGLELPTVWICRTPLAASRPRTPLSRRQLPLSLLTGPAVSLHACRPWTAWSACRRSSQTTV